MKPFGAALFNINGNIFFCHYSDAIVFRMRSAKKKRIGMCEVRLAVLCPQDSVCGMISKVTFLHLHSSFFNAAVRQNSKIAKT